MWADGGMLVSVVRQGFFDKPRETMRAFRTHLRCLGNVAGCPEREVGQLSVLALPDSFGSVCLVCLEMEKSHGNQCVELFGCEF